MKPRNPILRETHSTEQPSSPNPTLSAKSKPRKTKPAKENAPPSDSNSMTLDSKPSPATAARMKSPLPPRPPSSNPLKRKLSMETVPENSVPGLSDSGVKVVVRMRPPHKNRDEGDMIVQRVSDHSLSINGQTFTFDAVTDTEATQLDIFQLVGAPLVENCMAGFNSSVFAYGQTGSGKTYTMWGPANALSDENLSSEQQGLTPRVFERLFARINEEQLKHADKQLKYQCHCSFLEIYNEQITDLLDPSQKNLLIREDVKSGVYVENLKEECVRTMEDVTQLLMKGLSNRRTGATSINSESSRSHTVFTCVVESRSKSVADGLSSFKTSRINLVDLAGSERQKLTDAAGERLKEAGNINRSLSQLGNLINILAEISQTGRPRHIPYRDSRLTFLLQESLGGNAKLAMVCAISPAQSCKNETFSTLRFAHHAKAIKNKAVVNEVRQDDVHHLREVIRQLRDELQRIKANGNSPNDTNGGPSASWIRRSLNLIRSSISRPISLPHVDDDGDEEMEIDEEAVEKLYDQLEKQSSGSEVSDLRSETIKPDSQVSCEPGTECAKEDSEDIDVSMEEETVEQEEIKIVDSAEPLSAFQGSVLVIDAPNISPDDPVNCDSPSSLSIVPCDVSPLLKSPNPSVSPRMRNSRKSLRTSSMLTASQKDLNNDRAVDSEDTHQSLEKPLKSSPLTASSTQRKDFLASTEQLAASICHGLEIISSRRQSSVLHRSSFRFSYKPLESKVDLPIVKVDAGVQTSQEDESLKENLEIHVCTNCKRQMQLEVIEANDNSTLQLVPVDVSDSAEKSRNQVPKAVEKVLAGAIRREMALEEFCAKQASEIIQLNRLVQQYKHERECNAILGQTREDKILRLEGLMDGILPTEEFMEEELASLTQEHKLLKEKYDNHPEVLRTQIELKRVQDELESCRSFYEMGEREVLLEEIQDLRSQLQYYTDSSSRKRNQILQLTNTGPSSAPPLGTIPESVEESAEDKLQQERFQWTEAESNWISLSEELKSDLEASRLLAEKRKKELETEKKCAEELTEAMQMAMQGHARLLEQYADLEEKHMHLLGRHRKIQEGIADVKKAAAKAGVKGAESRFINALAAEISALRVEKEKERRYFRDEIKGLQAQLRDTAEAVQAAGELLVRLKEAEEAITVAQKRAMDAEHETANAYKQVNTLKRKHEKEISTLNALLADSCLPKEAIQPTYNHLNEEIQPAYDEPNMEKDSNGVRTDNADDDQRWREEFEPFYNSEDGELQKLSEPSSWFSGYDRCNI